MHVRVQAGHVTEIDMKVLRVGAVPSRKFWRAASLGRSICSGVVSVDFSVKIDRIFSRVPRDRKSVV